MRRYLLIVPVLALVAVILLGTGCVGGSSSASETKSPFEALQDRVSAVESKANSNSSTISSQASQLRTDLDALSADIVDLTNGTDIKALSNTVDGLEGMIGEIPEPEDPEEETPTLVELIDEIATLLELFDARVALLEAAMDIGGASLVCEPLNITFLATAGGSNPSPQYLTVDIADGPTAWVATVNYPVDLPLKQWLFVTPAIGNEDDLISVSADIATGIALPAGVYYAKITLLTATDVVEVSITLMVSDL